MTKYRFDKYAQIEAQHNRPMRDILSDLFSRYGEQRSPQQSVADELGVTQSTISEWIVKSGMRAKTILVPNVNQS